MKIKLSQLRKMIQEEVDRFVRNSAGIMAGGLGLSSDHSNTTAGPTTLGGNANAEEVEREEGLEQEKSQIALRVRDRSGSRRQDGTPRNSS